MCLVGPSPSGKTKLLIALEGKRFNEEALATIGASFATIRFRENKTDYRIMIWDTAGHERFLSMLPMYTRMSDIILIATDLSRESYLEGLREYIGPYTRACEGRKGLVIVGTMTDLLEPQVAAKREADLETFAQSIGAVSIGVSAKTGRNIQALVDFLKAEAVAISQMKK